MKTGSRTDGSMAGVFTDLSDLLEEGTTSQMRKVGTPEPPAARELHRIAPTSLMVDTQPTEFVPVSRGPISDRLVPDESQEVEALLQAPTSQTLRFAGENNPAAAFAPPVQAPPEMKTAKLAKTDPLGDVSVRRAMEVAPTARASAASMPPPRASMPSFAPALAPPPARFSLAVLLAAIAVTAVVVMVITAVASAKLVRACHESPRPAGRVLLGHLAVQRMLRRARNPHLHGLSKRAPTC